MKPRIALVIGTRPDAIKSAPVYLELMKYRDQVEVFLISTGQHREMLKQVLDVFKISPDVELDIMQVSQSLSAIASRSLVGIDHSLEEIKPDFLLAQGDTSATFFASLAAFYRRIPFGHIEAGLRTDVIDNPFPEEFNRRATSLITAQHYAPTEHAKANLLAERYPEEKIFVTGNTGIDAMLTVARTFEQEWLTDFEGRVVLLTTHRRENWGKPQSDISEAVRHLADDFPDICVVVPMHKNPIVRDVLMKKMSGHERIRLIEPPDYASFVKLMQRSYLILTDSGGIQEEAPAFGIPVLVLRETTERPEGVESGNALLAGTDSDAVYASAAKLLEDSAAYNRMSKSQTPYGDGRAAERIRFLVLKSLGIESKPVDSD